MAKRKPSSGKNLDLQTYSVLFNNLSAVPLTLVLFQMPPDKTLTAAPLAWSTTLVPPSKQVPFVWQFDYSFNWAKTGDLEPGEVYKAEQTLAAELDAYNKVRFTRIAGQNYELVDQTNGLAGDLAIVQDTTIAQGQVSVGIGMSGTPIYAVPAQPNISLSFRPPSSGTSAVYYLFATPTMTVGTVLDSEQIADAVKIKFPQNINLVTATLTATGGWKISPTA